MKVAALYQFYLPYVLPRAADWDGTGVLLQGNDFSVKVRARGSNEALFPNDVDQTLSSMTLTLSRVCVPTGEFALRVRDQCYDRVEALVEGDVSFLEDARTPEVQDLFQFRAIQAVNQFLAHCRIVARCASPLSVGRRLRTQDQKFYVTNPHSTSWFDGSTGEQIPVFPGDVNALCSSGAIASPERGGAPMAAVQAGLARGALPDLVDTLFLDVEEAITALRLREALLLVGTVLEIASDQYIERLSGPQDPRIKKVLSDRWVSFGEKRFNRIPKILSNRTLSSDATESFANLDRAYRARNAVAHNGRAVYREGDREIEVDAVTALRFLEAARRAADWLASL